MPPLKHSFSNMKVLNHISVLGIALLLVGCTRETEIVSVSNGGSPLVIIGRAEKAPFSDDPNLYMYLRFPSAAYRSPQADNVLIMTLRTGEWCGVFKASNGRYFMKIDGPGEPLSIENPKQVIHLHLATARMRNLNLVVLGEQGSVPDVEAILMRWHSGGVFYYGFNSVTDGLEALDDYNLLSRAIGDRSGAFRFGKWKTGGKPVVTRGD